MISRSKKISFWLLLVIFCLAVFFVLAEIFLRLAHLPGVEYNNAKYDSLVGYALYPDSTVIYRNARGDFAARQVNSFGFLDTEHAIEKKDGVYRIGFFGDSFVEARQVSLDDTFFRLLQKKLGSNFEVLAFGGSGYGTLQSYLSSQKWTNVLDLDLVVYVFCENDPGDQIKDIKGMPEIPYPVLQNDNLSIDNSFLSSNYYTERQKPVARLVKFLGRHSLLAGTALKRVRLLLDRGVNLKTQEKEMNMEQTMSNKAKFPNQNDLPSTWPSDLRAQAEKLEEAVILKWRDELNAQSRKFVLMYIPRGTQMEKPAEEQDSWKKWLETFCEQNGITFIDPGPELVRAQSSGQEVFFDHFSKGGHQAFARSFADWLNAQK